MLCRGNKLLKQFHMFRQFGLQPAQTFRTSILDHWTGLAIQLELHPSQEIFCRCDSYLHQAVYRNLKNSTGQTGTVMAHTGSRAYEACGSGIQIPTL